MSENRKAPLMSVVIVTYNSEDTLGKCLDSLDVQTLHRREFEVVVIDNGSKDGSVQLACKHKLNPTVVAWGKNLGFGEGNNLGVRFTRGELLVFVNPDTTLHEDALEKLKHHDLASSPSMGIIGGNLGKGTLALRPYPSLANLIQYHRGTFAMVRRHTNLVDLPWVCGAFLSIKKSVFKSLGGFDKDYFLYYEETDLCKKVSDLGLRVCVATDVKADHAGGTSAKKVSGGVDSTQNMIPRFRYLSYLIFMRKHHGVATTLASVILECALKSLRMLSALGKTPSTRRVVLSDTRRDLVNLVKSAFETRLGTFVPAHPWSAK